MSIQAKGRHKALKPAGRRKALQPAALALAVLPLVIGTASQSVLVARDLGQQDRVAETASRSGDRTTILGQVDPESLLLGQVDPESLLLGEAGDPASPDRVVLTSPKGTRVWSASAMTDGGIPAAAARAYRNAAAATAVTDPSCQLPWTLLAGIGRVESDHGRYGGSVL
ncbi:MAG: hypothetical protein ACRDPJ_04620, partial [Nocardioidaceae bacterium]